MKTLSGLNIYKKTSIVSLIVTLIVFGLTIPCFFINLKEVPLGVMLGGILGSTVYLIFSALEKKRMKAVIAFTFIKLGILILVLIGDALLYYLAQIYIFNLFAIVGGYLISVIVLLIISGKENKNA